MNNFSIKIQNKKNSIYAKPHPQVILVNENEAIDGLPLWNGIDSPLNLPFEKGVKYMP